VNYIGIDVHKRESQLCILGDDGNVLSERRIRTERARFAGALGDQPRARIVLEAATESEWVAQCLEGLGHEVIVADPNFAPMYAQRSRRVKTDRRDARALADAARLGAYRAAHRTSPARRPLRMQLTVREALVRTRARYISLIRALLRREGLRVRTGTAAGFLQRREALSLPPAVAAELAPLAALLPPLTDQIAAANARLAQPAARQGGLNEWSHPRPGRGAGSTTPCLAAAESRLVDGAPAPAASPSMRRRVSTRLTGARTEG
jgi:transposase